MTTTRLDERGAAGADTGSDGISTGGLTASTVRHDDFVDHGSPVLLPPAAGGYAQMLGFCRPQAADIR